MILLNIILIFMAVLALSIILLLIVRKFLQMKLLKKSKKYTSADGYSLVETVNLGGINQSILIQACDKNKPVLLMLHGGPGMPFPGVSCRGVENISQVTTSELIENFVLVYWDQRGTGKSYSDKISKDTMNIKQYISDANELIDKLRDRFKVNKVYLAGISWGSVIGLNLVSQVSHKLYAYFGMAQIINWAESDKLAYPWVLEYAKSTNNKKAVQALQKVGAPPYVSYDRWKGIRGWLMRFGGFTYKDKVTNPPNPAASILNMLVSPDYALKDFINTFKGMPLAYNDEMIRNISEIDFLKLKDIDIPVYFFQGKHDKVCQPGLMVQFFNQLNAPNGKKLVWLDKSAHFFHKDDARTVEKFMTAIENNT